MNHSLEEHTQQENEQPSCITSKLNETLFNPIENFLGRKSKGFRGTLAQLSYDLVAQASHSNRRKFAFDFIETLHSGSLIVDDIQDSSLFRRGKPTLHRQIGLPLALNAGNWLYFQPIHNLSENLSEPQELSLYRAVSRCLYRAHQGQAIDLGTNVLHTQREHIAPLYSECAALKTGALMELATLGGAILGEADAKQKKQLGQFGFDFGISLQKFDDIGNFASKSNPEKRLEDLKNKKLTFVWAVASRENDGSLDRLVEYTRTLSESTTPEVENEILNWFENSKLKKHARMQASVELETALSRIDAEFSDSLAKSRLLEACKSLKGHYEN